MGKKSPKQFWKHINSFRKGPNLKTQSISIDQFAEHFKSLSNKSNTNLTFNFNADISQNDEVEELDRDISLEEIEKAIHSLKRGKSPGFDGILSDFLIDAKEFIAPYLL